MCTCAPKTLSFDWLCVSGFVFSGQAGLQNLHCMHASQTAQFCIIDAAWLVCRNKYQDSVSTPVLAGDSVQMYFKDSSDPTTGKWYTGQVVDQGQFDYKAPATLWDSVTVLWEDESKSILARTSFAEPACLYCSPLEVCLIGAKYILLKCAEPANYQQFIASQCFLIAFLCSCICSECWHCQVQLLVHHSMHCTTVMHGKSE